MRICWRNQPFQNHVLPSNKCFGLCFLFPHKRGPYFSGLAFETRSPSWTTSAATAGVCRQHLDGRWQKQGIVTVDWRPHCDVIEMISRGNSLQLVEGNRLVNWISFIQPFFQWNRPQDGFECAEFDFGFARVLGTMMFCLVRSYLGGATQGTAKPKTWYHR